MIQNGTEITYGGGNCNCNCNCKCHTLPTRSIWPEPAPKPVWTKKELLENAEKELARITEDLFCTCDRNRGSFYIHLRSYDRAVYERDLAAEAYELDLK